MLATKTRIPAIEEVFALADELELPRPTAHRACYNVWFLALHEIGHYAVKPQWYRDYASVIYWDGSTHDRPCAPLAPDLWMLDDPTPDEECVRLWCIQACEYFGWTNPVVESPEIFGGSNYNPRQWYVSSPTKVNQRLLDFGLDAARGKLMSDQQDITLPYPNGRSLPEILANHDRIYQWFEVDCNTRQYSEAHLKFLAHLSKQIGG